MKTLCKRIIVILCSALAIVLSNACLADNESNLVIINHYDKPLTFNIALNHQVLPHLLKTFMLACNSQLETIVTDPIPHKQAYVAADDKNGVIDGSMNGNNSDIHNVFFGIGMSNNRVTVYGYKDYGIAYSWQNGSDTTPQSVLVFCTPEEYAVHGACSVDTQAICQFTR